MQGSTHILGLEEVLVDEQLQARAIVHLQHTEVHRVHRARLQLPVSIEDRKLSEWILKIGHSAVLKRFRVRV